VSAIAIPEKFRKLVLELAASGKSTREISAHLVTVGVTASHNAVAKLLRHAREERSEVAKVVVREELASTLTADIGRLEHLVRNTMDRIVGAESNDVYCKLAEQARKIIETKLKYSGAAEPDAVQVGGVRVFLPPEE